MSVFITIIRFLMFTLLSYHHKLAACYYIAINRLYSKKIRTAYNIIQTISTSNRMDRIHVTCMRSVSVIQHRIPGI